MQKAWVEWAVAAVAIFVLPVAPARAASVTSPRSGETVSAKPAFTFDFARGNASVELSKSADVKSAGDDAGAFVDEYASDSWILGGPFASPQPYLLEPGYPGRLGAGRYFWHARLDDYADDDDRGDGPPVSWGPVQTLTVRDEPAIFEGWTLRAQVFKRKTRACKSIVRFRGKVAFSDNEETPNLTLTLRLKAGSKTMNLRSDLSRFETEFDHRVCTRRTNFSVAPFLRDSGNHVTPGPIKSARATS